jgi:hypothetical protein
MASEGTRAAVPAPAPSVDDGFESRRDRLLERAAVMASQPDVRGLMRLQDEVRSWEQDPDSPGREAVEKLLLELDELTNRARERQLGLDRRLLLERGEQP